MKTRTLLVAAALCVAVGCGKDCNKMNNPVSKDYPCGTRAHPCSVNPLMCCWNTEVCGGPMETGCPAGMCCYTGEEYLYFSASPGTSAASSASATPTPSAKPGASSSPQWTVEKK